MQSLILDYKKNSTTNSIFPIKYWNLCIELRLKFNRDYHISLKRQDVGLSPPVIYPPPLLSV